MKKVIYTCIVGGYDKIPKYKSIDKNWDYVLFTDNPEWIAKKKINHWEIKPLVFDKLTNVKNARWHKVNVGELFPEYDVSVWLDGNVVIRKKSVYELFENLIKTNVLVAIPLHPVRNCIYDEARIIKKLKIDYPDIVNKQVDYLKKMNFPKKSGLNETNIMFRRHNDKKIIKSCKLWWNLIEKYSKRDQLSANYAYWKNGVNIKPLYEKAGYHTKCSDIKFIKNKSHNRYLPGKKINQMSKKTKTGFSFWSRIFGA